MDALRAAAVPSRRNKILQAAERDVKGLTAPVDTTSAACLTLVRRGQLIAALFLCQQLLADGKIQRIQKL